MKLKIKKEIFNTILLIVIFSTFISFILTSVNALPIGPTVTFGDPSNTTKNTSQALLINSSVNGSTPGGYIFTITLDSIQQNTRWKAYVGNVTGTLTLDDANDNSIFQWSLTTIAGEVFSTRASGTINWTGINCTWIADGRDNQTDDTKNKTSSNRTPEHNEEIALSHTSVTSKDDNVTATFANFNHSELTIGGVVIAKNDCFSVQTFQKDAVQVFDDSDNANFTQVILYDGAYNRTTGNVVYATFIENNEIGYRSDEKYDFQMIVPEDGSTGFVSSTPYYFYVELT